MILIGGALVVAGSFLPWITIRAPFVGTLTRSGTEGGDGIGTLIVGIVIGLAGLAKMGGFNLPSFFNRSPIILGAIAALIVGIDLPDILNRIHTAEEASPVVTASVGSGVWTVFVGAALTLVGGLQARSIASKPQPEAAPSAVAEPSAGGDRPSVPVVPGVTVTHYGERYYLGVYRTGFIKTTYKYAIWPIRRPTGVPLREYSFTDEGRRLALAAISELEPDYVTNPSAVIPKT